MTSGHNPQQPFRPDTAASRQRIFERIAAARAKTGGSGVASALSTPADAAQPLATNQSLLAGLRGRIADPARGPQPSAPDNLVDVFVQRALLLSCTVDRVSGFDGVARSISAYLRKQQLPANVVAWPALKQTSWLGDLEREGLNLRLGAPAGDDLVGLSAVACAVAETGTLVLRSSPDTPASTHLLPETHIAVLAVSDIVLTLEDAFERLKASGQPMPRALNLVSGPSRTGDIEQTIVLGAHGPYRVHLVLVESA